MASTGWKNPATAVGNIACPTGTEDWANPTNIYSSNDVDADANLTAGEVSNYLRATNFSMGVPEGATIDGIVVEWEKDGQRSSCIVDYSVIIVKAGSAIGDEKAMVGFWSTSEQYYSYGGSTDKWGNTWTAAQINASDFGVELAAINDHESTTSRAYIDHVRIDVYYTEVTGTNMEINISDVWKDVSGVEINISDSWKTVTKIQININDVWKTIFEP